MTVFLDASVIVAILAEEHDGPSYVARLEAAKGDVRYSSVVVYEATFGLARKAAGGRTTAEAIETARSAVVNLLTSIGAVDVAITGEVSDLAIKAGARFGKVIGHPARLNMGDCFAYACARASGATLIYKGDDFARTDIGTA